MVSRKHTLIRKLLQSSIYPITVIRLWSHFHPMIHRHYCILHACIYDLENNKHQKLFTLSCFRLEVIIQRCRNTMTINSMPTSCQFLLDCSNNDQIYNLIPTRTALHHVHKYLGPCSHTTMQPCRLIMHSHTDLPYSHHAGTMQIPCMVSCWY